MFILTIDVLLGYSTNLECLGKKDAFNLDKNPRGKKGWQTEELLDALLFVT